MQVAERPDTRRNGLEREPGGIERGVELVPRERRRDGRARKRPDRVPADDLLTVAIHLHVYVDALPPLRPRLRRHQAWLGSCGCGRDHAGESSGLFVRVPAGDRHEHV